MSICSELIIDDSADEEIRNWYRGMEEAYNVVNDTVKGQKVEK